MTIFGRYTSAFECNAEQSLVKMKGRWLTVLWDCVWTTSTVTVVVNEFADQVDREDILRMYERIQTTIICIAIDTKLMKTIADTQ
jgi:hypothetical protein